MNLFHRTNNDIFHAPCIPRIVGQHVDVGRSAEIVIRIEGRDEAVMDALDNLALVIRRSCCQIMVAKP